jgi:hypothetical protein
VVDVVAAQAVAADVAPGEGVALTQRDRVAIASVQAVDTVRHIPWGHRAISLRAPSVAPR